MSDDIQNRLAALDCEWVLCRNRKLPGRFRVYRWEDDRSTAVSEAFDNIDDVLSWLESPMPIEATSRA
jgi:hypothetical protein